MFYRKNPDPKATNLGKDEIEAIKLLISGKFRPRYTILSEANVPESVIDQMRIHSAGMTFLGFCLGVICSIFILFLLRV